MEFKEIFLAKYRVAREAAIAGEKVKTLEALKDLEKTFKDQAFADNDDSISVKATLRLWAETWRKLAVIIEEKGLDDSAVISFFGLKKKVSPFIPVSPVGDGVDSDISNTRTPRADNIGGFDISGLIDPDYNADKKEQPHDGSAEDNSAESGEDNTAVAPDDGSIDGDADVPEEKNSGDDAGAKGKSVENPVPSVEEDEKGGESVTEELPVAETPVKLTPQQAMEPQSLEEFVGQQHVVKPLLKEVAIAKNEGRHHLDNVLLFGNPGLGKSTLMKLLAKALGVRFEFLDCSQFRRSQESLKGLQNFFMRIARENVPVVIGLDEIHKLSNDLQESLLILLNDRVFVSPPDVNGNIKRIPIPEFTFVGATTNDEEVIDTLKNRCIRLTFQLVDYSHDELRQIYLNKVAARGLSITEEAIEACIPRSRGAIRYVNAIVEGLNSALYDDEGRRVSNNVDLATALKYFNEKGIDSVGLYPKDLEIMRVIATAPNGVIGVAELSARVGLTEKKYVSEYERYLIKIGFVNIINGKGRSLSDKGIAHLKAQK